MLIDNYGRIINYLRVSVTSRCNFRCKYCMPDKPFSWTPIENILSFEELFLFIKLAIDEGVTKIRITGGEPLLRNDLDKFIYMISSYKKDIDLSLTTNGYLLPHLAKDLKQAGLNRINISLDSLNPKTAQYIANKDILQNVLDGIEKALSVGLKIKINTVALKGINEHEMVDILNYCKDRGIEIRFIEYMENSFAHSEVKGLLGKEILELIKKEYSIKKVGREGSSPAFKYEIEDDGYVFGLIDPHKHDFCESCNRIRLSAEGHLIPCLYFDEALNIKDALKNRDIQRALDILKSVLNNRPKENKWSHDNLDLSNRAFFETGG